MDAIRLVPPGANSVRRGGCQQRIATNDACGGDRTIRADDYFQNDISSAVGSLGIGGILWLTALTKTRLGQIGS